MSEDVPTEDVMTAADHFTSVPNLAIEAVGALELSATAFVVYCALRSYLHGGEACWPGRDTVCDRFGIPVRTFQRALTTLQETGMLVISKDTYMRGNVKITRNIYHFTAAPNWHKAGAKLALGSNQNWHSGLTKIGTRYKGEEEEFEEEKGKGLFEAPAKLASKPKVASTIPAGFALDDAMRAYALAKLPGVDVEAEFERFVERHKSIGSKFKDWSAAWRTWVLNEIKYRASRVQAQAVPTDVRTPLTFRDPYLQYASAPAVVGDPWADR